MPEQTIGLKYSGNGFIAGVPARDLSPEEVTEFGGVELLTKNGVYSIIQEPPKKQTSTRKEGDQ